MKSKLIILVAIMLLAAIIYRKKGPKPIEWSWDNEDESTNEDNTHDLTDNTTK